jgi:hypothetical protein
VKPSWPRQRRSPDGGKRARRLRGRPPAVEQVVARDNARAALKHDCNGYVRSRRAEEQVMAALVRLFDHLRLRIKPGQVRQITCRSGGRSLESVIAELRGYLIDWKVFFRLAETPGAFAAQDERIRPSWARRSSTVEAGRTTYRKLRAEDSRWISRLGWQARLDAGWHNANMGSASAEPPFRRAGFTPAWR